MQARLAEQGVLSRPRGDGELARKHSAGTSDGVRHRFNCSSKYRVGARYAPELSAYSLEFLYWYYMLDVVSCLVSEGAVAEPPRFRSAANSERQRLRGS